MYDQYPFRAEYALSEESDCHGRMHEQQNISEKSLRIGQTIQNHSHDGSITQWYHYECFVNKGFDVKTTDQIGNFNCLRWEDQDKILGSLNLKRTYEEDEGEELLDPKKPKLENVDKPLNEQFFQIWDELNKLPNTVLNNLIEQNRQEMISNKNEKLNLLTDIILFGALEPCIKCGGKLIYEPRKGYKCMGNLSEWVGCNFETQNPRRTLFRIPEEDMERAFLKNLKCGLGRRVFAPKSKIEVPKLPLPLHYKLNDKSRPEKFFTGAKDEVDSQLNLQDVHVYKNGNVIYSTISAKINVQQNLNSYYKMQILENEKKNEYRLFKSWGRIGEPVGAFSDNILSLEECMQDFRKTFEENTSHSWESLNGKQKKNLDVHKKANKYYPIGIVTVPEDLREMMEKHNNREVQSTLSDPVFNLVNLIFDETFMKQIIHSFELDEEKMPLGLMTRKQIQEADEILDKLKAQLMEQDLEKITELTNKFYTFIPQRDHLKGLKLIDNASAIESKFEVIKFLKEKEMTLSWLKKTKDFTTHPTDNLYQSLNLNIMSSDSDKFRDIKKYLDQSISETSRFDELEIKEVFSIDRLGEEARILNYHDHGNRKLLWHGLRNTNLTEILSQGLKIAPIEVHQLGQMFGNGIYFADMATKSAGYCLAHNSDIVMLLLCEVALGSMYECYGAENIERLPEGKHSTFGRGRKQPDPAMTLKMDDLDVPIGTIVDANLERDSELEYNEYIVYNESQVKLRYLVRTKVKSGNM